MKGHFKSLSTLYRQVIGLGACFVEDQSAKCLSGGEAIFSGPEDLGTQVPKLACTVRACMHGVSNHSTGIYTGPVEWAIETIPSFAV